MASVRAVVLGLAVLLVATFCEIDAGVRVARSPQFGGGFSQASAQAQAGGGGGFGGGFGPQFQPRPGLGPGGPGGYRPGGFGQGRFRGPGFGSPGIGGLGGGSISISKSISISRGGAAQSSAGSFASGK